ncbi:MAG: hypothetical protein JWP58_323 [Hymenobacter sp.]|nr:hypothetical protein [Hymenobacter sp.]
MSKTATFSLLLLVFTAVSARAQSGCTDPRATNFSPTATSNDGSCQYAGTSTALVTKATLDSAVPETSGLQFTGQALWTFNDSGNLPVLFRVDSASGNVVQRVRVTNFPNVDWEDIAADAQYLYVGDFGNNNGNRRDLRVLRVLKSGIGTAASDSVAAEEIAFSYPDQTNFNPGTNSHNFDCEAFFYFNDSLHLFTKNWADHQTKYYTIPAQPGGYTAHFKSTFNVNGLITAADINPAGSGAGLLGYNSNTGATFLWLLSDFRGSRFLQGNKRRIDLPNALTIGQAEGLTFVDRYRVFISNERLSTIFTVPQRLYALNTSRWLAPAVPTGTRSRRGRVSGFIVAPNPAGPSLRIERADGPPGNLALTLQDLQGRPVLRTRLATAENAVEINVSQVAAGVYMLTIDAEAGTFSRKIEIP